MTEAKTVTVRVRVREALCLASRPEPCKMVILRACRVP